MKKVLQLSYFVSIFSFNNRANNLIRKEFCSSHLTAISSFGPVIMINRSFLPTEIKKFHPLYDLLFGGLSYCRWYIFYLRFCTLVESSTFLKCHLRIKVLYDELFRCILLCQGGVFWVKSMKQNFMLVQTLEKQCFIYLG